MAKAKVTNDMMRMTNPGDYVPDPNYKHPYRLVIRFLNCLSSNGILSPRSSPQDCI